MRGKEVVQLYVRDHFASISPSLSKLKRFTKIELEPSEKRTVAFTIGIEDLKFYGKENKWIVEEGKFSLMINSLSKDFIEIFITPLLKWYTNWSPKNSSVSILKVFPFERIIFLCGIQ